jgi:hypothetical protein
MSEAFGRAQPRPRDHRVAVLGLSLAFVAASAQARAAEPALRLRLTAGRTTYDLVDGGKPLREKLDDFRKLPQPANHPLEPLAVDLTLQITNLTSRNVTFWSDRDDRTEVRFELKGPGAVVVTPYPIHTLMLITLEPTELAPRHTKRIKFTQLVFGSRHAQQAYWTVPGRYTLRAFFDTAIKPPAAGTSSHRDGFEKVTLTSNPVTIDVRSAPAP